jgi:formate hydrogenlyase transcriptional activator
MLGENTARLTAADGRYKALLDVSSSIAEQPTSNTQRLEAVLRISEAVFACRDPEALAKVLADQLGEVLSFDHLDLSVFKENSRDIEWRSWGKGPRNVPEVPVEELPAWHVFDSQEPLLIVDWKKDERFPHLKELVATKGIDLGSVLRIPLTTPHGRLGTLGIASRVGISYSNEDVNLMRRIASVVAFAVDDAFNLRKAQQAQAELQRQNDRLQLLLSLTNRITSNIEFHELLRAIAANIREVMQSDAIGISLPDAASGKARVLAVDFPHDQGILREEFLVTPTRAAKRALETSKPVIADWREEGAELDAMARNLTGRYDNADVLGWKTRCVIPLVSRGRTLGLLSTSRKTDAPFTAEEVEFLTQASGQIAIAVENALAYGRLHASAARLEEERLYLESEINSEYNFENIVGKSAALRKVLDQVAIVAPTGSTVLLHGETGTGKELFARAVHHLSPRRERTFVRLNCAAIPSGLVESELFGHEKGAFTGALMQKRGRFELADGGTLFLDEIGDISLDLQPKLLRALQEHEFERLGSTKTIRVDVRLIAATHRDLSAMIENNLFREDLFYRLNVFSVEIPPLRERREDIPLLVHYFVSRLSRRMQKRIRTIPKQAMEALVSAPWPGNVRELENFIERCVIVTQGDELQVPSPELKRSLGRRTAAPASTFEEAERQVIIDTLKAASGKISGKDGAAERLGLKRSTLQNKMRKLNISRADYTDRVNLPA